MNYKKFLIEIIQNDKRDLQKFYIDNDIISLKENSNLYLVNIVNFIMKYLKDTKLDKIINTKITYGDLPIYSQNIILIRYIIIIYSHYILFLSFSIELNPIIQYHVLNELPDHSTIILQKTIRLFLLIQNITKILNKDVLIGIKKSLLILQNLMKPIT